MNSKNENEVTEEIPVKEYTVAIKENFVAAQNQALSVDYLIYSCLVSERLLLSKSWQSSCEIPSEPSGTWESTMEQVFDHYVRQIDILKTDVIVNLANVDEVSKAFFQIAHDLKSMLRVYNPEDHQAVHRACEMASKKLLGSKAKSFDTYWRWLHRDDSIEDSEIAVGDRPPVGRYMPRLPRRNSGHDSGRPGDGRGRSSGKPPRRGDKGGGHGFRPAKPSSNQDLEAQLKKEVSWAIERLKKESLDEIELAPQNSFRRRLQHHISIEMGCQSTSRGDEPQRCVVLRLK